MKYCSSAEKTLAYKSCSPDVIKHSCWGQNQTNVKQVIVFNENENNDAKMIIPTNCVSLGNHTISQYNPSLTFLPYCAVYCGFLTFYGKTLTKMYILYMLADSKTVCKCIVK